MLLIRSAKFEKNSEKIPITQFQPLHSGPQRRVGNNTWLFQNSVKGNCHNSEGQIYYIQTLRLQIITNLQLYTTKKEPLTKNMFHSDGLWSIFFSNHQIDPVLTIELVKPIKTIATNRLIKKPLNLVICNCKKVNWIFYFWAWFSKILCLNLGEYKFVLKWKHIMIHLWNMLFSVLK